MNIKTVAFLVLFSIIPLSFVKAQVCEDAASFSSDLSKFSEEESKGISETTETLSTKLTEVMEEIKKETYSIMNDFQKYILARAATQDALNKIKIVRDRKKANVIAQITKMPPDFDDRACAKATNAPVVLKTETISSKLATAHKDQFLTELSDARPDQVADMTIEHNIDWFSNNSDEENPFANADVNAGSLFSHTTFKEADYDKIPSTDTMPNTLVAAHSYVKNLVDNDGVEKKGTAKTKKFDVGVNQKLARENLSFSIFADMLGRRTAIPGTKTGTGLRAIYSWLGTKGTDFSSKQAANIADDISEYEYKDYIYSKIYMNPDWLISLETPKKSLQVEELEVINKNMALEWDTLLMLEKLATLDSVELAVSVDDAK